MFYLVEHVKHLNHVNIPNLAETGTRVCVYSSPVNDN